MTERPAMTLTAVVLDSPDAGLLADFYQRLLGWPVGTNEPGWVTLRPARRRQPGCPSRPRTATSAGLARERRRSADDAAPRYRGRRSRYRRSPCRGGWRGPCRLSATGEGAGLPRPGRPSVLPVGPRIASRHARLAVRPISWPAPAECRRGGPASPGINLASLGEQRVGCHPKGTGQFADVSSERTSAPAMPAVAAGGRRSMPRPWAAGRPCRRQASARTWSRMPLIMYSACHTRPRAMLDRACSA